jgi:hypothetical protein
VTDISSVESRVAKGVVWLDANVYDWRDRVSLEEFDIKNECQCVLGQVFGNFFEPMNIEILSEEEAVAFGFDAEPGPYLDTEADWIVLQAEWTRVLEGTP